MSLILLPGSPRHNFPIPLFLELCLVLLIFISVTSSLCVPNLSPAPPIPRSLFGPPSPLSLIYLTHPLTHVPELTHGYFTSDYVIFRVTWSAKY